MNKNKEKDKLGPQVRKVLASTTPSKRLQAAKNYKVGHSGGKRADGSREEQILALRANIEKIERNIQKLVHKGEVIYRKLSITTLLPPTRRAYEADLVAIGVKAGTLRKLLVRQTERLAVLATEIASLPPRKSTYSSDRTSLAKHHWNGGSFWRSDSKAAIREANKK